MNNLVIKIVLITSFVLMKVYEGVMGYLKRSNYSKELPENVRDVYDEEGYTNWRNYRKEGDRMSSIMDIISSILILCFLAFNLYAKVFDCFAGMNLYVQYLLMFTVFMLVTLLVEIPFNYYDTFVIEEKYGMNKTTKKTFIIDCIKDTVIGILLNFALMAIIMFFFEHYGNMAIICTIVAFWLISLLIALIVMPLLRIYNKFEPLEEGELRNGLMELCHKYGVQVKKICVRDASRRTTKANAFCTGLTKKKVISLDDNLVNEYSTEQIMAVFAHEFAHAKYRHTTKSVPFGLFRTSLVVIALGVVLNIPGIFTAFGFAGINYFFALNILSILTWPLEILLDIISNYLSRKHEYQADAFAAKEGYGEALISSLKKLCRDSYSDINPHPVIVFLKYSHPTLSERIDAITSNEEKA